jgi:isoamylase
MPVPYPFRRRGAGGRESRAVATPAYFDPARGRSVPLGATVHPDGVNFSVYSSSATGMELVLFDDADALGPSRVITLDPRRNRSFRYWHAFVPGIGSGQLYGFRAQGPFEPARGLRFDPSKLLLDPYGRALAIGKHYDRERARLPGDNAPWAMKSVVVDPTAYDWEGDLPLERPFSKTIIYEMHVAGFTRHPSAGVTPERRGTFAGLIEKIPYLTSLGITAVELLPVFQFDEHDAPLGRLNYWGYSPVSFFAPHDAYSWRRDALGPLDEFRDMVKALHRAGIEVILDVVYNHTAEGDERGPTLCFRGLSNLAYYVLDPANRASYANFSGTGNVLNANHSVVRRLVLDSLRYWVSEMHVDGFRFDLASVFSRDEAGLPLANPSLLWEIETDPGLAGTKIIAEAWDAAGLNQVGRFIGDRWKEWNGHFRDDVRSFFRADNGTVTRLRDRVLASPDLFGSDRQGPEQSVNFVTCHDGFTLNDLVSYEVKHNEANGEGNRDGMDDNRSWNCGVEGPTDDPAVEALRNRQVKNFLAVTILALGTPMILMGDEVRRTQRGNNNAYCQDNETSWFDWSLLARHADVLRFVQRLTRIRLDFDTDVAGTDMTLSQFLAEAEVEWHGVRLHEPDWSDHSHSLAVAVRAPRGTRRLFVILNGYWEPLEFELPPSSRRWRRLVDTSLPSPDDCAAWGRAPGVTGRTYRAAPRSVVVLVTRVSPPTGGAEAPRA